MAFGIKMKKFTRIENTRTTIKMLLALTHLGRLRMSDRDRWFKTRGLILLLARD